ncbi:putative NUDIX/MutT-family hydrolase [Enhygromyxa salina]|uniref:Putative NUDIX/MutT-family hydrolase n=1 Tax=Enhygromyxa salina TaxID=215803 RepID=A0A0C2CL08_9BACT|nr:NUDIX hydrolase [Enhygromyxa salina]KIG11916.1 putative NUDIX/MutT-family hydrolase [Enhygromyxa salina]
MTTAVQPAATVVVLRPRGPNDDAPELYMLRRSSKSAFMPDALVFPGGRVEAEDAGPDAHSEDQSFARAARRECIEEASLTVELDRLRWFDTWKTPSGESPRRFMARFYLTTIPADQGHDAIADGVETRAGRWASAASILDQWRAEQVDLPPPTLSILLGLAAGDWRDWLAREPAGVREPILPKVLPIDSSIHIVMPHDPDYAGLPGDTGSVPERVLAFPRRFIRAGKRWVPQT